MAEILEGTAGFARNLEQRDELVDYTPGLYKSIVTILIRRPSQEDFSLRYFTLEFTPNAWKLLLLVYTILILISCGIIFALYSKPNTVSYAVSNTIKLTFRALIQKVIFLFTFDICTIFFYLVSLGINDRFATLVHQIDYFDRVSAVFCGALLLQSSIECLFERLRRKISN